MEPEDLAGHCLKLRYEGHDVGVLPHVWISEGRVYSTWQPLGLIEGMVVEVEIDKPEVTGATSSMQRIRDNLAAQRLPGIVLRDPRNVWCIQLVLAADDPFAA